MTFTFVSNYINHHQKPFCDAMYELIGDDFAFVQTMPMEAERVQMGWSTSLTSLPYVKLLYEDAGAKELIMNSDIVLFGWSEREDIVQERLLSGKRTMRVSERLYRDGTYKAISPRGLIAKYKEHIRFRKDPVYMLCAGAYTAADFNLIHAYPNKLLKWGYFPPFREYMPDELSDKKTLAFKNINEFQLVWAGRFIPLKHAEFAVRLANELALANIPFHMHMIGSGELEDELKGMVSDVARDKFTWYGFLNPDEVRDVMEGCHIHMCTSNQLEGWGAVVNEGMNSGCVEIVSDRMGATPFLIQNGENGLCYSKDSYDEMRRLVYEVIQNWEKYKVLGEKAYFTIRNEWNAKTAAKRLYDFVCESDASQNNLPKSGPLSPAPIMKLR